MPANRPNLLFIMPDQLRPDFLSCYGASFIDTPHIDNLCDSGVRYEKACASSPVCVPMRSTLLTGLNRYPHRRAGQRAAISGSQRAIAFLRRVSVLGDDGEYVDFEIQLGV